MTNKSLCYNQSKAGGAMSGEKDNKIMRVIHWAARIWSALMAGMILLIFIGEGIHSGFGPMPHLTPRETVMMIAFVIVFVGLVLAWRWEILGGSLLVLGMAAFYLLDYLFSGFFPRGPVFLLIASPGVLFLVHGVREKSVVEGPDTSTYP